MGDVEVLNKGFIFDGVTHFFFGLSQETPVVLCIDDLHWAPSIELMRHLARNIGNQPVLIVATYRDEELENQASLWSTVLAMNRERLFYELPLQHLGVSDVKALIASRFDSSVAAQLVSSVYRKTEGNPFFIEEVLQLLQERRVLFASDAGWQLTDLESLLLHRFETGDITQIFPKPQRIQDRNILRKGSLSTCLTMP